eukprot:IDg23366t1
MRQTDYGVNLSRVRLRRARLWCMTTTLFYHDINLKCKLRIARRASMLRRHFVGNVCRIATLGFARALGRPCRRFWEVSGTASENFWEALERMIQVRGHLILNWRDDLMNSRAALYADHIHEHAPLDTCVGYMDCTTQKVSRPGGHKRNQRALYTGHKRTWCLKWQSVSTPDGFIFHLWGPEDRRRHDS